MAGRQRPRTAWSKKIKYTDDLSKLYLKLFLKGGPGVGKTTFMGTSPKLFALAYEPGLLTLFKSHVPAYQFDNTDKGSYFDITMAILDDIEAENEVELDDGTTVNFAEIETIGLDSVAKMSELLKLDIDKRMGATGNTQAMWGELRSEMAMIMNRFYHLNKHVIVTCGEATKTDEATGKKYYTLNMQGGYKDQIEHEFDFVLWMQKEVTRTGESYFTTGESMNGRSGKMRGVRLDRRMDAPTFDMVWKEIESQLKARDGVDNN